MYVCWTLSLLASANAFQVFNVFWANHLHSILSPTIVVNAIDPGFCRSEITRNITGERATMLAAAEEALAYTTEEGGRSIVYGLTGEGTDGKFVKCMAVDDPSEFSRSDVGKKVQNQLWVSPIVYVVQSKLIHPV